VELYILAPGRASAPAKSFGSLQLGLNNTVDWFFFSTGRILIEKNIVICLSNSSISGKLLLAFKKINFQSSSLVFILFPS
jgi:hypothetical protein